MRAAVNGELDGVETVQDPIFGLHIPTAVPGVDAALLNPVETWSDPAAFETTARRLAAQFVKNFEQYAGMVPAEVLAAAPDPGDEVAPDFGAEG